MFATPQDFIDTYDADNSYGTSEYQELFNSKPELCQNALDQAWGLMLSYLHRYVPFPAVSDPMLPYEVALKTYQLMIARFIGSQKAAPREQVIKDRDFAFTQLKLIASGTQQLPIYNPAVVTESPVSTSAQLVSRGGSRTSFASYARRWG
jgi:hypothetical protein